MSPKKSPEEIRDLAAELREDGYDVLAAHLEEGADRLDTEADA